MRKKQTFLLTVLAPETDDTALCGKLKVISSGKACTFTSLDDLYHLLLSEASGDQPDCQRSVETQASEKEASQS